MGGTDRWKVVLQFATFPKVAVFPSHPARSFLCFTIFHQLVAEIRRQALMPLGAGATVACLQAIFLRERFGQIRALPPQKMQKATSHAIYLPDPYPKYRLCQRSTWCWVSVSEAVPMFTRCWLTSQAILKGVHKDIWCCYKQCYMLLVYCWKAIPILSLLRWGQQITASNFTISVTADRSPDFKRRSTDSCCTTSQSISCMLIIIPLLSPIIPLTS